MFEFIEEPLDKIALSVEPTAEGRGTEPVRHGADISPGAAFGEALAKGVGIIRPIRQENVPGPHGVKHVLGAAAVMSLPLGQLERDRQAVGIDEDVDFGRQPAARATHATGSDGFFLPFAAC